MSKDYLKLISAWQPFADMLKSLWDKPTADYQVADEAETNDRIWHGIVSEIYRRTHRRRMLTRSIGVAACVACVMAAAVWMWRPMPGDAGLPAEQTCLMADSLEKLCLPDSTVVWLERGSVLTFDSGFMADRCVSLKGNATFEVAKVDGKRFVVRLDDSDIVVKGTCFSIQENEVINVTLYNGSVEFVSGHGNDTIELKPSQRLTYVPGSGDIAVRSITENLRWENGAYKLSQIELSELVDFMEGHYDVEIAIAENLRADKLRMTGTLRYDEPLDSMLQRICYVFKLGWTREGDRYMLAEKGSHDRHAD